MTDWAALPARIINVNDLVWPCHDIDPDHLHADTPDLGPLHVERLADGSLFVHDGRHRAIRAINAGHISVLAKVIEHGH